MDRGAFSTALRVWRKTNLIGQKNLAARLGVTQSAISRWETGAEQPSQKILGKLKDLMAERDPVRISRLMIERQGTIRALYDLDGIKLLCCSQGLSNVWPTLSAQTGSYFRDDLINEIQGLVERDNILQQAHKGEIAFISGVSERHIGAQIDTQLKHRWHIQFIRHGLVSIGDMLYEPCAPDAMTGVEVIQYLDEINAGD